MGSGLAPPLQPQHVRQNDKSWPIQPNPAGPRDIPNGRAHSGPQDWTRIPSVLFDEEEKLEDFVNVDNEVLMDDEAAEVFFVQFECVLIGRFLGR